MKSSRKSADRWALAVTAFALLLMAQPAAAKIVDRVIAKVNGDIITLSSVEERAAVLKQQLELSGETVPSDKELIKDTLERIIEEKLQIQEAKKSGLEVDDEAVQKALDEIKTKNRLTEEQLGQMLELEGRSMEQYKGHIRDQILVSKVVRFHMGSQIKVKEEQLKKYYREHQSEFWIPKKPYVRHILFITDETFTEEQKQMKRIKARSVLTELEAGADFAELAKLHSEDVSASAGGELGLVEKGTMVPEFERAAFLLREGETSGLVESRYGFHIIKVDKVEPGGTRPYSEVKEAIRRKLSVDVQKDRYESWMSELKENSIIEISLADKSRGATQASTSKSLTIQDEDGDAFFDAEEQKEWEEASRFIQNEGEGAMPAESDYFADMEKKLSRIKQLRREEKITETEYQRRKQRLLDQL